MVEISTSILNVDNENATTTFYNLETAHTDYFHIDVMDGRFVENNNFNLMKDYATTLRQITNIPLDIHFMTEFVKDNVDQFIDLEPNIITFHLEAMKDSKETFEVINFIKENHIKCGIAIKPNTNIEDIYEYLPYIHMVLVMTVEPGKGGQQLIYDTLEKVKKLKEYIETNNYEVDIEVDGGINIENSVDAKNAGANILVAGSAIIKSQNFKDTIKKLKD